MKRLHVVGRKNHGKTTLVADLIGELTRRGLKVGAIKHTSHSHELDRKGSDSHQLRVAGGTPSTIVSGPLLAAFIPRPPEADYEEILAPIYADCDLVLVEGNMGRPGPKIEVWREAGGTDPIVNQTDREGREDIIAVVSDDAPDVQVPIWPRQDLASIADGVVQVLGLND